MRVVLDSETTRKKWRARRVAAGATFGTLVLVNILKVGFVDELWPVALAIVVVGVCGTALLVRSLERRDARVLSSAPPGTLFTSGGNLGFQQLRSQARFYPATTAVKSWRVVGDVLSVEVTVNDVGLAIEPTKHLGQGVLPIDIRWSEVATVALTKLPAKFNVAGLDLQLADGSRLSVEVRGYDRLRLALERLRPAA